MTGYRHYIDAAESSNLSTDSLITGITNHIVGMDLHPVAVTFARVTYLLAIGRDRIIASDRGDIKIPVYLGDSLQFQEQSTDLWSSGNLVIRVDDNNELFENELRFPDGLLEDAGLFDRLVDELAKLASSRTRYSKIPSLGTVFQRFALRGADKTVVQSTFETMCMLHDEDRNHIWGYYVRNLARPLWLARNPNRVDALIGNPPWLAYRNMPSEMQSDFRDMSIARGIWSGAKNSTHQDLAGLFVERAIELYLAEGGRFGFVLPNTTIDREHYSGFRTGDYESLRGRMAVTFSRPWDLRRLRPHFFPRAACVVFGERTDVSVAMSNEVELWAGQFNTQLASWSEAEKFVVRTAGQTKHIGVSEKSPYQSAFTQGATFSPHFIFNIQKVEASALGLPQGKTSVKSSRSVYEKKPWKNLPDLEGVVETELIRNCFSGENIFPYRFGEPSKVLLPCSSQGMLNNDLIELNPGYSQWWKQAQELSDNNSSNSKMSLRQRLDYQSETSA